MWATLSIDRSYIILTTTTNFSPDTRENFKAFTGGRVSFKTSINVHHEAQCAGMSMATPIARGDIWSISGASTPLHGASIRL